VRITGTSSTQSFADLDVTEPLAKPWTVTVLDWPEQAGEADELARSGHLRLLLVAPGVAPPIDWDLTSDWLRRPADPQDVLARIETMQRRAEPRRTTRLDADGLLWRGLEWVALAPVEIPLMACLLRNMDRVVGRHELDNAAWPDGSPGTRALDTRLQRLRSRIAPLGLQITNVRQRGFLLAAVEQ
jgi:hypothetical protein